MKKLTISAQDMENINSGKGLIMPDDFCVLGEPENSNDLYKRTEEGSNKLKYKIFYIKIFYIKYFYNFYLDRILSWNILFAAYMAIV